MLRGLLARLECPVTFVVGKGGVGKTTTAGGLALALADDGTRTHLLSTDPAHSLGDLFRTDAGPDPTPSPCTERLVLEALDAERVARARLGRLEPSLRQLIDRGTYLDEDDAESLLAGSVPGLDEIGGALRILELVGASRLIVDTAPTGHTLRLLDVPRTLEGWVRVFDAMADKADTVASALLGRSVRMGADAAIDELCADLDRFERALGEADFVIVGGAGAVVVAETERLARALAERGLRVAATVAIRRPGAEADILLPFRSALVGCDALRDWLRDDPSTAAAPVAAPGGASEAGPARAARRRGAETDGAGGADPFELLERDLVVFAGKGGVGKTTSAAAAALRLAEGRPTRLLGVDPAGSLVDVLGGEAAPGLEVVQVDAEHEMERFRASYRDEVERVFQALGLDRAAGMDRAVIESLLGLAPPGMDEVVAVTRLAADDPGDRRLVLDAAPTGHFLRLLAMPELALDWTHRIMRILLKYRAMASLDAPGEPLLRFARRLRALRERLTDSSRTAIILVTLDEHMVRSETLRLADRLRGLGITPAAILVNRARGDTPRLDPRTPTLRAPEVEAPVGVERLRGLAAGWERVA